jgi:biopolymer transport protein ExbB
MLQELLKLYLSSGPVILTAIFIASVWAFIIIIERTIYLNRINLKDEKIVSRLGSAINNGHYDEALTICETKPSPLTNLMKAGIKHREYNDAQIQESIKDAAKIEINKLESRLTALGTIANVTPLLGLLGTVIGNMQAFGIIGEGQIGNMEALAGGIAKALITTAFGLTVAIPASIFYNAFTSKVNNLIIMLELQANELVLVLSKSRKQGSAGTKRV